MVPLGVSVADTDQLSSSEDKSSKSRQSETALERRKSPKPVPPNSERMDVTSCKMSTTVLTDPANSEGETLRHCDPTMSVAGTPLVHRNKAHEKMNVMVMVLGSVRDKSFVEESAIFFLIWKKKEEHKNRVISRFHSAGICFAYLKAEREESKYWACFG